ncbi:surfeit locus protein 4 homolog [Drosophila mojavensis]|uniref:Uncharacterized protein n=1 Tax=Drosophila mojavensis TaxID=7230 RepID=B4L235_DROMO|nr:surfeit locus protein 4 homolog [Drosophila mojavensis]EDW06775.1 uncharacterized protein Dmoj_GI15219 [Drosophila mojavensis]
MEPISVNVRSVMEVFARLCIICNFLADSVHLLKDWTLERVLLNLNWHCGDLFANFYITTVVAIQLIACSMVFFASKRQLAAGILGLLINLRIASNPMLWSLEMYTDMCALILTIVLTTVPHHRFLRCGFLIVAYMTYKSINDGLFWRFIHRYGVKMMIAVVLSGYQLKWSSALLLTLLVAQSFKAYAWWVLPYSLTNMPIIFYLRFKFWQLISMLGGLILTAVNVQEL